MESNTQIIDFKVTDAAIAELGDKYSQLKIVGINDEKGYKEVRAARLDMRNYRTSIDKRRKELTEDALKHQRLINSEAKRITDLISAIEEGLSQKEKAHEEAKQAILDKILNERLEKLEMLEFAFNGKFYGCKYENIGFTRDQLMNMKVEDFDKQFGQLATSYDEYVEEKIKAEKAQAEAAARLEAEKAAERELIERQRKENEEQARILKEQQEAMKAEQERIAKEQADAAAALKAESDRIEKEKESLLKIARENVEAERLKQEELINKNLERNINHAKELGNKAAEEIDRINNEELRDIIQARQPESKPIECGSMNPQQFGAVYQPPTRRILFFHMDKNENLVDTIQKLMTLSGEAIKRPHKEIAVSFEVDEISNLINYLQGCL